MYSVFLALTPLRADNGAKMPPLSLSFSSGLFQFPISVPFIHGPPFIVFLLLLLHARCRGLPSRPAGPVGLV